MNPSRPKIRSVVRRAFLALTILLVVLAGAAGCNRPATLIRPTVEVLDRTPAFQESPPERTALFAVITTLNLLFPEDENATEDEIDGNVVKSLFHLGGRYDANPFADCPRRIDSGRGIPMLVLGGAEYRKPRTVLEAYCLCANDLSWTTRIKSQPTVFGYETFKQRRAALADSLAMVAHQYIQESIEAELDSLPELGRVMGHLETVDTMVSQNDPTLYLTMLGEVWNTGEISPELVEQACEILGVDALLCVAVDANRYGVDEWRNDIFDKGTMKIYTNAAVFSPRDGLAANYSFNWKESDDLHAFGNVGPLLRRAVEGSLGKSKPTLVQLPESFETQ